MAVGLTMPEVIFRGGLRGHDRAAMTAQVRAIVDGSEELAWMKGRVDAAIAEIENELNPGRLYVVADDTVLLKHAAHYLIYGSEWIAADDASYSKEERSPCWKSICRFA